MFFVYIICMEIRIAQLSLISERWLNKSEMLYHRSKAVLGLYWLWGVQLFSAISYAILCCLFLIIGYFVFIFHIYDMGGNINLLDEQISKVGFTISYLIYNDATYFWIARFLWVSLATLILSMKQLFLNSGQPGKIIGLLTSKISWRLFWIVNCQESFSEIAGYRNQIKLNLKINNSKLIVLLCHAVNILNENLRKPSYIHE